MPPDPLADGTFACGRLDTRPLFGFRVLRTFVDRREGLVAAPSPAVLWAIDRSSTADDDVSADRRERSPPPIHRPDGALVLAPALSRTCASLRDPSDPDP